MTNTYSLSIFCRTFQGDLPSIVPPMQFASLDAAKFHTRESLPRLAAGGLRMVAATVTTPSGEQIEIGPLHPYAK